jgi:peroxiredoxin
LSSIHRIYQEIQQDGLQIVLINVRESSSTVREAVKKRGYSLPVLLDSKAATARTYGVWGTPGVYLIDSKGFVIAGGLGPHQWDSPVGLRVLKSFTNEVKQ